jgi:hypothetical protein
MKPAAWQVRVWPLVLIGLIGLVLWADKNGLWHASEEAKVSQIACASLASGCVAHVDGREIHFGMVGMPKPLTPFQVWVKAEGAHKVEVRFTMQGMEMGFNLYTLRADSQGVLRANVTLPVCVSGRRDWNMLLDVDKSRLSVPFVTEL